MPNDPLNPLYGLNSYIPAHDTDYVSNLDWYGSGDVNGGGKIDMKDYNSTVHGTNPYYDGTYRGDVNLNGISGDTTDKRMMLEFIPGKKKRIKCLGIGNCHTENRTFKKNISN